MKNIDTHFKQERSRIYDRQRHDAYRTTKKHPDPTICPVCGSLYTGGRWTWDDLPEPDEASRVTCPACRRTRDNYPAGLIELQGTFFDTRRTEIMNMIHHIKDVELTEHPLERFVNISEKKDKTIITTTGIHLARRIGDSLVRAYGGDLNYNYDDDDLIRVFWQCNL
ncbi:BCAM0308 family protein [Fodinibius sp.]|uniref:BCAM0308 family protein n=1 Tax=Fodinibius sp. TaxID=1872440 RepID=UPI003561D243